MTTPGVTPAGVTGRVGYGPGLLARAAWLVCAHHLPVRRAARVLTALAPDVLAWTCHHYLDALTRLFTTGAWLPPAAQPA
ncbi:hypothetical protein [Frankia sp. QA3]|uniref:hypothetical protein n=1 Tax=Frankia sp. QA3 TaxID=710111 RepID=UPI000269BDD9|nr:hypothetical protein [Frankia sp. QA3]EIV92325.1 Transposase IS66 family [Frankia sp. QA3]